MLCCPITKYPVKRVALSMLAVFAVVLVVDFVVHGHLLKDSYMATANLWRSEMDMKSFMCWMPVAQLIHSIAFTILFALVYRHCKEGKGCCGTGAGIGFLLSVLLIPGYLVQYVVSPLPFNIVITWMATAVVQGCVSGMILSCIFKGCCAKGGEMGGKEECCHHDHDHHGHDHHHHDHK